jgi:hypothetical protein
MRVHLPSENPITTLAYLNVPPGGRGLLGQRPLEKVELPILTGTFTELNADCDALILASDLQGTLPGEEAPLLLGCALADYLPLVFELHFPEIPLDKVGVLLCGDLYARPDRRGGLGDVRHVWRAFNEHFAFVAGVAGNHDSFGDPGEFAAFQREAGIYFLDGNIRKIGGMQVGGISGVIGQPGKPNRVAEKDFLNKLKRLALKQPDLILLHEGPSHSSLSLIGNPRISEILAASPKNTVCCGHRHWPATLVETAKGTQVINLDAKCLVLINQR